VVTNPNRLQMVANRFPWPGDRVEYADKYPEDEPWTGMFASRDYKVTQEKLENPYHYVWGGKPDFVARIYKKVGKAW